MQAAVLPVLAGWFWIQQGYRLFLHQPLPFYLWGMTTGLLITLSYAIPLFGQMALIVVTPCLTFITLNACHHVHHKQALQLPMWFLPLRQPSVRARLLKLGFAYLGCCLCAGFIAVAPFVETLLQVIPIEGAIDPHALVQALIGPLALFFLFYLLISALFWHAPALIGWHGLSLSQALFFSMVACWRNKWPFLLYGLSWAGVFFAVQWLTGFLLQTTLSPVALQLLLTPVNILVISLLYCSFYPIYLSVFGAALKTASDTP